MAAIVNWRLLAICVIGMVLRLNHVESSADVMKKLTMGFSKALAECKQELNLQDHIMQDFYNYWKEDYALLNREVGCAIMCMASKHDLISDDNTLHHGNAQEFAKKHGADDEVAKQLVTMLHECEKTHANISDDCIKTLEIAKCFRTKIHQLKWAPSMEEILEEIMADVKT